MGRIIQRIAGLHAILLHAAHRVGTPGEGKQGQADGSDQEFRHLLSSTQNSDEREMTLPPDKSTRRPKNTVRALRE